MDDNPYQSPKSPPIGNPTRKSLIGLSLLSVLVVPAAAIAGTSTCMAAGYATHSSFLAVVLGLALTLAIVYTPLLLTSNSGSRPTSQSLEFPLLRIFFVQIAVTPVALGVGFAVAFYATYYGNRGWGGEMPEMLLAGFLMFLVWALAAYVSWRWWIRKEIL